MLALDLMRPMVSGVHKRTGQTYKLEFLLLGIKGDVHPIDVFLLLRNLLVELHDRDLLVRTLLHQLVYLGA